MSAHDYLPAGEGTLETWAKNFSACLSGDPAAYGVTPAAAADLAGLLDEFVARRADAVDPCTRTRVTITLKDTALAALKAKARELARIVNACPAVTAGGREELGLRSREAEPTSSPVPETAPCVVINTLGGLRSEVRLIDEAARTRRRKPAGVLGAYLWARLDGPAPDSTEECRFLGLATRTRHTLNHPPAAVNQRVWIVAQWVNRRGEPGPLSRPVSASIAA